MGRLEFLSGAGSEAPLQLFDISISRQVVNHQSHEREGFRRRTQASDNGYLVCLMATRCYYRGFGRPEYHGEDF